LKYLREELPTVAFKCNTQQQRTNLGRKTFAKATENVEALQSSDCLGAETLLQLLKNYSRNQKVCYFQCQDECHFATI
jgi:nuclear GTP-binding protein